MNTDPQPIVIREIDIAFSDLVFFFLKCALALIPATFLYGVVLWLVGLGIWAIFAALVGGTAFAFFDTEHFVAVVAVVAFCMVMVGLFTVAVKYLPGK